MAFTPLRNAILSGYVDSYCLVCHTHLNCNNISSHIRTPAHEKNLSSAEYVEDLKDDLILKVKKGYYCLFCAKLIPCATILGSHVVDKGHITNKGLHFLKREEDGVIAFDKFLIEEKAWSGLTGKSCALCQMDYDNEDIHQAEPSHLLNLIRLKVQFLVPHNIFRLIDDNSFHCITCNEVFSLTHKNIHFESKQHKSLLMKCSSAYQTLKDTQQKNTEKRSEENIQSNTKVTNTSEKQCNNDDEEDNKIKIIESIEKFEKHEIRINVQNENVFCRYCCEGVEFNYKSILNHIEDHYLSRKKEKAKDAPPTKETNRNEKTKVEKVTNKNKTHADKPVEDIKEFAKENKIQNQGNGDAFCQLCGVNIPATLRAMKEHVNGSLHKTKHALMLVKPRVTEKCKFANFVVDIITAKSAELDIGDVIINRKFCIEKYSFHFLARSGCVICELCRVKMINNQVDRHLGEDDHGIKLSKVPVVTNLEDEFVREVRPGYYHCGYCNTIESGWPNLENHLTSNEHSSMKSASEMRLVHHNRQYPFNPREAAMVDENFVMMKTLVQQLGFLNL